MKNSEINLKFLNRLYPIRENFKPLLESKEALNIMNGIFIYR